MDNAMFAVNYMTGIVGAGFGFISNGFTAQVEATLFQLFRVRGNDMTASAPDSTRTNSTAGLHPPRRCRRCPFPALDRGSVRVDRTDAARAVGSVEERFLDERHGKSQR